jgi:hypothetical protein
LRILFGIVDRGSLVFAVLFFAAVLEAYVFGEGFFPHGLYEVLGNAGDHHPVIRVLVFLPVDVVVLHAVLGFVVSPVVANEKAGLVASVLLIFFGVG